MPPSPTTDNAMATDVGGLSPEPCDHTTPILTGHNRGPKLFVDPGVCKDFTDCGPIALRSDRVRPNLLDEFYKAVCTHGPEKVRQSAISNCLARARANPELSHQAYRVLEGIASRSRWRYGYHCESLETLAWSTAASSCNMRRPLEALTSLSLVARLDVPRLSGGRPVVYLTVICTAEDRSGQSLDDLARVAKLRGLDCESNRPDDELQSVMVTVSHTKPPASNLQGDGLQTFPMTTANLHYDDHTVDLTVETGLKKGTCPRPPKTGAADASRFEEFWEAFPGPRRRGKAEAAELFHKIVGRRHPKGHHATADELLDAVRRYAASLSTSDVEYAPLPSTWLNKARWLDPIPDKPVKKFDPTKVRRG